MRREDFGRIAFGLAFALALGIAWGCGGGGGGGGIVPPPTGATFTPDSASPAAGSVTMQAGETSGETFEVRIAATTVNGFFGSAFHVLYDADHVEYVSADDSGSFLRDGGASCDFEVADSGGDVAVAATRLQNGGGTVPAVDVSGTRDLIVLTFRATSQVTASPFSFGAPLEVRDASQPVAQLVTVSWSGGTLTAH